MFESLKRFGKFLKYGLQGCIGGVSIIVLFSEWDSEMTIIPILSGLFLIALVETIARGVVWIISGYFESSSQDDISKIRVRQMRNYYTYSYLRDKISRIFKNM